MTKQTWCKQTLINIFKGGLTYGSGCETVELFLDKERTSDDKLCLEAYDANLISLPPYSRWSKSAQTKCQQAVLQQTEPYNITVEIDDTIVKRKK